MPLHAGGRTHNAAPSALSHARAMPPKLRQVKARAEVRHRRTQQRMSEERRAEAEQSRPGWRRERARQLKVLHGRELRSAWQQVYGNFDLSTMSICFSLVRSNGLVLCFVVFVYVLQSCARSLAVWLLRDAVSPVLLSLGDLCRRVTPLLLSLLPFAVLLSIVYSTVSALLRYLKLRGQRQRLAGQSQLCAVCLDIADGDSGEDGGDQTRTLKCGHRFHHVCIEPWLAERRCCPLCQMREAP
eukprot:SRR837773.7239.p1 GENE.SRR837773.7239~~SRR837773.7239.p1  ORF type:complete len:242 (-),score=28.39 SRR837773.7239:1-726(-)